MPMQERSEAKTIFGNPNQGPTGVGVNTKLGTESYISLVSTDGTEWFLWMGSSGTLRVSSTLPVDPDNDGIIVGP